MVTYKTKNNRKILLLYSLLLPVFRETYSRPASCNSFTLFFFHDASFLVLFRPLGRCTASLVSLSLRLEDIMPVNKRNKHQKTSKNVKHNRDSRLTRYECFVNKSRECKALRDWPAFTWALWGKHADWPATACPLRNALAHWLTLTASRSWLRF